MAKKIEDLQQYWQEMAQKANLSEDVIAALSESLGDEAVAKVFRQGFVPVPEHHSTLDEVRSEAEARKADLDKWYDENALPAYKNNLAGIERLREYETRFGDLEPENGGGGTNMNQEASLGFRSKEEFEKYIEDKLRAQQGGFVGLAKVTPKITLDYYKRFGEVLDLDEVEKISTQKGLPPELAYQELIAPKVEEQRKADFESKIKEAEERGARQALSNHNLPTSTTPPEASVFFDREERAGDKAMTPLQEDRASSEAFNEGWASYEAGQTGKP